MTESTNTPGKSDKDLFANLRVLAMRTVEIALDEGKYVDGPDLAAALREESDEPLPPKVLNYVCRYLEGKVAKPKGRKPIPLVDQRRFDMILRHWYRRYLAWLQARRKRYGHLEGWSKIKEAGWWQGPPNERAARMAAHRWHYGAESWRSVHNRVSSRK